jgi:hypothetical protein
VAVAKAAEAQSGTSTNTRLRPCAAAMRRFSSNIVSTSGPAIS